MSKQISAESLYSLYPPVLKSDVDFAVIGNIIAEELAKSRCLCDRLTIYAAIDRLPEAVLDVLAGDFNVEWYDYEGTIEEKRRTIQECISIHRYKGTKYAVETALQSVYSTAKVQEWFEYGGEPYHFKVVIYDSSNDTVKRSRILAKVKYYKNLRSVLEETVFMIGLSADISLKAGIKAGSIYKRLYTEVKNYGLE